MNGFGIQQAKPRPAPGVWIGVVIALGVTLAPRPASAQKSIFDDDWQPPKSAATPPPEKRPTQQEATAPPAATRPPPRRLVAPGPAPAAPTTPNPATLKFIPG